MFSKCKVSKKDRILIIQCALSEKYRNLAWSKMKDMDQLEKTKKLLDYYSSKARKYEE